MKLKFSPYAYARVSVMKSLLLQKEDYDKLMKMGYNEALRYLGEGQYRQEMDAFDVSTSAVFEQALNAHLGRIVKKLYRISDKNMQRTLSLYLSSIRHAKPQNNFEK